MIQDGQNSEGAPLWDGLSQAEPDVSALRGGIANAGPEVSELLNVHLKDATDFHADLPNTPHAPEKE